MNGGDPAREAGVAVVVVSFNVREHLESCLASLADAEQVVVVDNNSSDGSPAMVRERFPEVELVAFEDNRGFAAAVNAGVARAHSDYILLLNPDAVLPSGGLEAMCGALAARPSAWAVGFRQVDAVGRFQLAVGPPPSLPLELVRRMVQRSLDGGNEILSALVDRMLSRSISVPWVAGSCLLVTRDAFERVGGFDERFFLYFEDIDFCLRLRRAGGTVWYDPSVTVVHHRGASAASANGLAERAYRDSQLWFWEKHRGRAVRALVHGYQRLRGVAST
jgi:N-acetylglucosaminyl-diphospho-decaprenol L-rhamnosyltransferase